MVKCSYKTYCRGVFYNKQIANLAKGLGTFTDRGSDISQRLLITITASNFDHVMEVIINIIEPRSNLLYFIKLIY